MKNKYPHEIIHAKYPAPDVATQDEQVSISKHELALKLHKAALYGMEAAWSSVTELLREVDKSLYIGDDLNDKDVMAFYIDVVKTCRELIQQYLPPSTK